LALVLYQAEWDESSGKVRRRLDDLLLSFYCVNVYPDPERRDALEEVSGQRAIPVLVDDGVVHIGERNILTHLQRYAANT